MIRGLPAAVPARGLDPWRRPKGSWALGTRMNIRVNGGVIAVGQYDDVSGFVRYLGHMLARDWHTGTFLFLRNTFS